MKKILKITRNIFLILVALIVAFIAVVFAVNMAMLSNEKKQLTSDGFCRRVSAGDITLNVPIYGKGLNGHNIVAMSGLGDTVFPADIRSVTNAFESKNKIAVVERPGYGLSDSTGQKQTVEYIVETCRQALVNAGCDAPYILMPYSVSGIYATYWMNNYPEEIEGVLYIDTIFPGSMSYADLEKMAEPSTFNKVSVYLDKSGLQRLVLPAMGNNEWKAVPKECINSAKALSMSNSMSTAKISEIELLTKNYDKVFKRLIPNDIPKIYVTPYMDTLREYGDAMEYSIKRETGEKVILQTEDIEDDFEKYMKNQKEDYLDKLNEYAEGIGNCEIVNIPGIHEIYAQKGDEVAEQLKKLISIIDKK